MVSTDEKVVRPSICTIQRSDRCPGQSISTLLIDSDLVRFLELQSTGHLMKLDKLRDLEGRIFESRTSLHQLKSASRSVARVWPESVLMPLLDSDMPSLLRWMIADLDTVGVVADQSFASICMFNGAYSHIKERVSDNE